MPVELCPMTSKAGKLCSREFGHIGSHDFKRVRLTDDERAARRCDNLKEQGAFRWRCALEQGHVNDHVYPVLPWDEEILGQYRGRR